MQTVSKLSAEFKNAPRDASLVPRSASSALNREETLGVQDKVLADNLGEENLLGNRRKHSVLVFVLNKEGKVLMPCSPGKARHLLKKKARVVTCKPFTIQLLYGSSGYKQPITLGIDAGYNYIGFSAVIEKKELISVPSWNPGIECSIRPRGFLGFCY